MELPDAKICFLGDSGVGKSSIISRCLHDTFDLDYENTIGVYFHKLDFEFKGKKYLLHVWDTAGQERFRVISRLYYRGAKAIVIVYDITQRNTFESLKIWLKEVKSLAPTEVIIVIVGNKCDLEQQRKVGTDDGKKFAESIGALFTETSACSAKNIKELFKTIVSCLPKAKQCQDETTPLVIPKNNLQRRKACCF